MNQLSIYKSGLYNILFLNKCEVEKILGYNLEIKIDDQTISKIKNLIFSKFQNYQEIYLIQINEVGNVYQDFWSNKIESFWLTYKLKSRYANCKDLVSKYYHYFTKINKLYSKCLNNIDLHKDNLILARAYANITGKYEEYPIEYFYTNLEHEFFPKLTTEQGLSLLNFPEIEKIGFYQIVPDIDWLEKVLNFGTQTIQLRIKNKDYKFLEKQIEQGIALSKKYSNIRLFINDYWEIALKYNAYGIHIGQDDLKKTDIYKISKSGLRLGISTHCYNELASAYAINPSYIAFGPIFHTTAKPMPFAPQGVELLKSIASWSKYKIVGIGGINLSNINQILTTKVNGFAVISALINHSNPKQAANKLLAKAKSL